MRKAQIPFFVLLVAGLAAVVGCSPKQEGEGATRGIAVAEKPVPQKRLALVIGNSRYASAPLANSVNDADLINRTLRSLGFETRLYTDRNQREMKAAIRDFGATLKAAAPNAIGVFYYAGHGVQVNGHNYLIPVDAHINGDADVDIEAVSAETVLDQMGESGNRLNFVILDACRNNPFPRSTRSASRGLAQMPAPKGVLIAYSTTPGDVAADGDGRNSPYSQALARAMRSSSMPAELMFKEARDEVMRVTADRQTPWEESSLSGQNFYFNSSGSGQEGRLASAPVPTAPAPEAEPELQLEPPAAAPLPAAAEPVRKAPALRVAAADRPAPARVPKPESVPPQASKAPAAAKAANAGRRVGGLVVGFGKGIFDASKEIVKPGSGTREEESGQQRR